MTRVVAVVGPTASGKTALAIRIAEEADGEIVSADSQQVYAGMDVGTGKATAAEQARVRHHLLDVARPDEPMSAARFAELADRAIADIRARGKQVVVCGGTGLYYRALFYGLFEGPEADPELRARLEAEPVEALWERLKQTDPAAVSRIEPRDKRRIVRALEVHAKTGVPMSEHQRAHDVRNAPLRYEVRAIGLDPPRAELYERINRRVEAMLAGGWIEEARALLEAGHDPSLRSFSALGYREIFSVLQGKVTLDEARAAIQKRTRRYARRQLSWFRAEPTVTWYKAASEVDASALAAWLSGP